MIVMASHVGRDGYAEHLASIVLDPRTMSNDDPLERPVKHPRTAGRLARISPWRARESSRQAVRTPPAAERKTRRPTIAHQRSMVIMERRCHTPVKTRDCSLAPTSSKNTSAIALETAE